MPTAAPNDNRWLLLIHQIPPKPGYLRVKIWRKLQRLGAVAIKNSVYALPRSEAAREDFQWLLREIVAKAGDATVCEARFVEGLTDEQIENLFHAARNADYAAIVDKATALLHQLTKKRSKTDEREQVVLELRRLKQRLAEVLAIDLLCAPGRAAAERAVAGLDRRLAGVDTAASPTPLRMQHYQGRTWVTRKGVHVDRMACAWLIRRFIDKKARFKFVASKGYEPSEGELRFDMFEAEFTHEGERCSFEVLIQRFGIEDHALQQLAEIIHDIDLKDGKFGRDDALGVDRTILGMAMSHPKDERRLQRSGELFDDLYEFFKRKQHMRGRGT
jgi:hypothetical protein